MIFEEKTIILKDGKMCIRDSSYTGKSGRHRITRQPEERIRPNRTAETPKTDSTCKGENEDASKKEFAGAAAVLMHGGGNGARRRVGGRRRYAPKHTMGREP